MSTSSPARRRNGEGSIRQVHDAKYGCPPVGPDKIRPDHTCRGIYQARTSVTDPTTGLKVRKSVYGKTENEVVQKLRRTVAEDVTQTVVVGRAMTLSDWLDEWYEENSRGWKVNTRKGYRSKIKTHLKPHLGKHRLDRLAPEHVKAFYKALRAAGLAEPTVRGCHLILQSALQSAMRQGKVQRNVCQLVVAPATKSKKREALEVEEAWAVLNLAGPNPRFWLALLAGIRQGEALALRWSNVNLDEGWIFIDRALSRNDEDEAGVPRGLTLDHPKSDQSRRKLPLPDLILDRLRIARAKWEAEERRTARLWDIPDGCYVEVDDLVFVNGVGGAVDTRRDYNAWHLLLDLAEVKRIELHAARNTTAHLLEDAKVPARVVMELLGHSQVQQTHGYQAGNLPAMREAMTALDTHMRAKAVGEHPSSGGDERPRLRVVK